MDENNVPENVTEGLKIVNQTNMKILENEESSTSLQPKLLQNASEPSTNFKQSKYKDDKYAQHKDLMNCIAFEKCDDSRRGNEAWNETRYSDDFDSLSSDTTSDITDVSPQPLSPPLSSSGCSSMAKVEKGLDGGKRNTERKMSIREQANNKQATSKAVQLTGNNDNMKKEEGEQALKFLKDALNSLDCGSSVKTNSSAGKHIFPRQRNMTFNREQMRTIDRENMILLRKIQCSRRRPIIENTTTVNTRISSSAINRQRQQRKIEFENSILLQKIQRVKGTTNTMTGLRRF
ncbi:Uncharacterized protein GBIM_05209 [Gryllus bimaculatus]|nr:Uncharacterized protein GBIM_05209 [Gryllus bimaculatus]